MADKVLSGRFIRAVKTNNLPAITELLKRFPEIGESEVMEEGLRIALTTKSPLTDTLMDVAGPDTTLWVAAKVGDLALVKKLVRAGATPNAIDMAITNAAESGHLRVLRYLLRKLPHPEDVNIKAQLAAEKGHGDVVMYLWDRFPGLIDVNELIVEAAKGGDLSLVEDLISEGATDFQGAVDNAASAGNTEIVRFLTNNYKVDIEQTMDAAFAGGDLKTIKLLVRRGGDLKPFLSRATWLDPSKGIPILEYAIKKFGLTPEQVNQIVQVINSINKPKFATFMIANGFAHFSDFPEVGFTTEDIKTLIWSGIDEFGRYASLVPAALELIRREDMTRSHIESHVPTAMSDIVMGYS